MLFRDPACGFCQRMLEPLKRREAEPPDGAPQLLIVSTSDEAANRAQGFQSPVALDQAFRTGHAFGASGTPSAVLVDATGTIASPVVAGASAVFELFGMARSDQTVQCAFG